MLTCISATEASATEVTRGSEVQTVTADVDGSTYTIYTGSTYCCVTVPPLFEDSYTNLEKGEIDDGAYR